jgi:hypothetical protein
LQQQQQSASNSAEPWREATESRQVLPAAQQQQSEQAQRLGTAMSWLVNCLLAAVPHQQLALVQLALATAVAECTRLMQQQQQLAAAKDDSAEPVAKKARVAHQEEEQQQQHQQQQPAHGQPATSSSSAASIQAKQLGVQLLIGLCCCESLQHGSRSLVAAAAVAAAATVVGDANQAVAALQYGSWLYRQLCLQITAPANAAAAAGEQDAVAAGLQAPAALAQLLQQLSNAGPALVLQLVHMVMGSTPAAGPAAQQTAAAVQPVNSKGAAVKGYVDFHMNLRQLLADAAKQWRALPDTACQAKGQQKGRKGGKAKKPPHQSGLAAAAAAAAHALAVPLKQVMPDAPNVNATWVCRHVVPALIKQAHQQLQALDQQQQQQVGKQAAAAAAASLPAVAALAHILAAEGLLLPAAGEVLVSARYLAEALNAAPDSLQSAIAAAWRQQLEQRTAIGIAKHAGAPVPSGVAAVASAAKLPEERNTESGGKLLVPWKVLQPMLCLLSYLEQGSPLAQLLADLTCGCLSTAAASTAGSGSSSSSSSNDVRVVLQHILLPVRFAIKMPARLWLLQQLLTVNSKDLPQQLQSRSLQALAAAPDAALVGGSSVADAVLVCLKHLLQGEAQQQLTEGLKLAGQHQQGLQLQQQGAKAAAAGAGSSDSVGGAGAGLSLQQMQALHLAAGMLQLVRTLRASSVDSADPARADAAIGNGWQQQAAQQLQEVLQSASGGVHLGLG